MVGPAQPTLSRYPSKLQAGARRSFHAEWYSKYDWLEYSQQTDAAFCFACRHFIAPSASADTAFTVTGYCNWKKAFFTDGGFACHIKSPGHVQAYIAWKDFLAGGAGKSVVDLLSDERARQISDNRMYLSAVIDVLKFTSVHRLAQRGHDEKEDAVNCGNFLSLMHVIGKYNDTVGQKLVNLPRNAKYTSKDIQNEILAVMARMIRTTIAEEVRQAGEFSIMADETKDCRKIEQLSIVLRYFLNGSVYESFVGFVQATDLTADGLCSELITELQNLGLDYKAKLIGQGYDGASVMSGKNAGVAKLMKNAAPFALYVHCHAHRLNLVLVDCMKRVPQAAEFFVLLEQLYVFVSGSCVHARWVQIQRDIYPNEPVRELQRLSDTRWACRYAACKAVSSRLCAVMQLLTELEAGANAKRAVEARALLRSLDCWFVLTLVFISDILGRTQSLSLMLQSATIDFSSAVDLTTVVRTDLAEIRLQDEHFSGLCSDAGQLCETCNIEVTFASDSSSLPPARKRKLPAKFGDSCILDTVGDRADIKSVDGFRVHVYCAVIDSLTSELERRFAETHCSVLRGIQALNPTDDSFADFDSLQPFAAAYDADVADLSHEVHQARRLVERIDNDAKPANLLGFISYIGRYKEAFPELYRLGNIAVALPVSTASCERSFSCLRHIKTWVRNSISNDKLQSVAILAIERERAQLLDTEAVIDAFAAGHRNRRIALV